MKLAVGLIIAALVLIGCSGPEAAPEAAAPKSVQMPTAVGVTAGQSGTGVTSGGSTGY